MPFSLYLKIDKKSKNDQNEQNEPNRNATQAPKSSERQKNEARFIEKIQLQPKSGSQEQERCV